MAKKAGKKTQSERANAKQKSRRTSRAAATTAGRRPGRGKKRKADAPVTRVKLLHVEIYGPNGWNPHSEKTPNPSWPQIETAIRRLDRFRYPWIWLFLRDDETDPQDDCLTVMGGRGAYFLDLYAGEHDNLTLFDPKAPDEEIKVWESDQGSSASRCEVTSNLRLVLRIARHFANMGEPLPEAPWATPAQRMRYSPYHSPAVGEIIVAAREIDGGAIPRGAQLRAEKIEGDWYWGRKERRRFKIHRDDVFSLEKGLDHFAFSVWKDPTATDFNALGMLWCTKGEFDCALESLDRALQVDRASAAAYNLRAWLRATCSVVAYRNGNAAVKDATRACELTSWSNPATLDTLAAALAEAGRFIDAAKRQQQALAVAPRGKQPSYRARLKLYQQQKPYRTPKWGP